RCRMINSVLKAIDIISLFSLEEPRLSLTEISRRLDLPKSTAHNLLTTLHSRGFVERTEDDQYALGVAIIARSQAVRVNVELRDRAARLLRELADASRESVYLTTLDGPQCLYIYAIESPRRLLARTAIGERVPLHCTAVGKAILAHMPDAEVGRIAKTVGLSAFTSLTITTVAELRKELELTRKRGYSIDREEHETGTYCIGGAILDSKSRPIGACSVSGVDPEIVGGRLGETSSWVMHTAQEVSRRMGYVPSSASQIVSRPQTTREKS
ncbi:MAG TPA: IclR family transcriptional regulator, partial [Spirochaetia bacterium]